MTYQTGSDATCRRQFNADGFLTNVMDTNFRAIGSYVVFYACFIHDSHIYRQFPVFAFSVDLGTILATPSPVVWAVGYVRDPVVNYVAPDGGTQLRRPYFLTQHSSVVDAV